MITKDRPNSVLHLAGKWTWSQLKNLTPPQGSTNFMIIYYSTATATNRAQTPWLATADYNPAEYIAAQQWRLERICAVVYQKPDFQRRKKPAK